MTGTALTEETEFREIYGLDVIEVLLINLYNVKTIMMLFIRQKREDKRSN